MKQPSITQSVTITVNAAPAITTTSLPGGIVGTAYSGSIAVTGGTSPLAYSVSAGSLPAGLTLNSSTGAISGTPTGPGSTTPVSFTVKVTDSSAAAAQSVTKAVSIAVSQAPAITSANKVTFVVSSSGTFTVTASGVPAPALSESGALPSGVTFIDNGNGTGTLSGTPAAGTAANYSITFTANNGVGTAATQSFTLTIGQAPAITSANATTFTAGTAGTFNVTTSGFPAPALSESGALPSGVSFKDNGNGTATVSGIPASGTGKQYALSITASNGVGSNASQSFTLTVDETPAITSANKVTLTVLTPGTFSVTTSGYPTPSIAESGALPTGVTFVDNGNGTGTLAGTPASGTAGNYPITFTPNNGVGSPAAQSFTLTIGQAPAITSGSSTTFTAGTAGTFSVTTSGFPKPALSETGALPSGVTFTDNGNGTATLAGTPGASTGGTYNVTITANNGVGSNATQSFTLTVDQAPVITSANSTAFSVGGAGTFTVTTSGFPKPAIAEAGTLPTGVSYVDNGNGTGTLSGTPASGTSGSYSITFTASNGIGSNATQSFILTVNTAPVFTSVNNATFTAGTSGSFNITATGTPTPAITESGALPAGVIFTGGSGTATLSGTPGAGTGGTYSITFTASNGVGTNATQTFTLKVDQAPAITSANNATFTEGAAMSFTVTTSGVPAPAIGETGALPSGITFV
ncbi:MAG: putative Ig domain-containing protein, partial [Acidobacteriota bacterium]|nr:putative Ig domain-containing protein [Acidobacteriota bacterium]